MREGGKGKAIWLAGVAAIAPVAIASIPVEPVQASPAEEFRPPQEPMVLTRTLRKHLSDGAEIVTRRSYEIHFVPESGGYVVEGRLLSVLVDAPPALQALAEIERARRDKDMFPIKVDRTGRLVFGNAPKNSAELRLASAQSLRQVSEFGLSEQEGAQARAFVGQFEARQATRHGRKIFSGLNRANAAKHAPFPCPMGKAEPYPWLSRQTQPIRPACSVPLPARSPRSWVGALA